MNPFKPKPPGKPDRPIRGRLNSATPPAEPVNQSGHVTFDDRGQAIWEWSMTTGRFETASTSTRLKKLTNVELSLVDDPLPVEGKKVQVNRTGAKKGYDPYDSGRLSRTGTHKIVKKDLRKLGEWINLKNKAAKNQDEG
jgi:hypothetical protein